MQKRGVSRFSVEYFFCLTVLKHFAEEPICDSENFWYRNFSCIRERGVVSRFSVVLIKLKNVGNGWDSSPYLALQKPVVLPTVPWEQWKLLTNVSQIIKIYGPTEIRTRTYCLKNVCPNPTA